MTRALCFLLLLLLAACSEAPSSESVRNECIVDDDCERGINCDRSLGACVRGKTTQPYQLIVRVSATAQGTALVDAGITLVAQSATELGLLTDGRDAEVLRVPSALGVSGSVRNEGQPALLASQLTLVPRDALLQMPTSVVETRYDAAPRADAGAPALPATWNPELSYDLRVQPLLESSGQLPPIEQSNVAPGQPLDIIYPAVEMRAGKIGDRGEPLRPDRVRLEEPQTGRIVSSSTVVSTTDDSKGSFKLFAEPTVFQAPNFNLVLGLAGFDPWQVTISIDGARFLAGGDIYLPQVPPTGTASGWVKDDETGVSLPHADLLFVSRYPVRPDAPPPSTGGADWCRWEEPSPVACSGRFHATSDDSGFYRVDLVPGEYDAYILPRTAEPSSLGVAVSKNQSQLVLTESLMANLDLEASHAPSYRGTISAVGATRVVAPSVTVRAAARPTPPFSSWGKLADYNRSYSVKSDAKGEFELFPDVGYYDFVVEPGAETRFPWKLWLDCPNGPEASGGALPAMNLVAPVIVSGVVESEAMVDSRGVRLPGARIEAFAVVARPREEPRSVLIGRTVSDDTGTFHLALPPRVGEPPERPAPGVPPPENRCEGRAVTDSARFVR